MMLQIQDVQKTKAAFQVMFQSSGHLIRRNASFTAICILVSIKIIRTFNAPPLLTWGGAGCTFFQISAIAKLIALPWVELQPTAAVRMLQCKWTQRVITRIGAIYSKTAAPEFPSHPFHNRMSHIVLFFLGFCFHPWLQWCIFSYLM